MLTPEDIRTRSFLVSLRGYDREEVSSFLDEVAALVEQLQSGDAPPRPTAPAEQPIEQATEPSELFAQIGQETQRILEAAQQAGGELRRKAQEESEAMRRQAQAETTELRERTESETAELRQRTEAETAQLRESTEAEVAEQRRTAEAETAELRRRTEEETQAARAQAEQEAEQLRQQVKAEAEREVKDARARATKLIADGERRRETMEREMADLIQTRERTIEQLREIGRTLERTLRASGAQEETTTSVREALEGAAREDAEGDQEAAARGEADHEDPGQEGAGQGEAQPFAPDESTEEPTAAEADEEGAEVESRVAAAAEGPEGEHFSRRTTALSTLQPKLVRKLKRGLQDLQNGTLDRLRREDGRGDVEQFLPDEAAVRSLGVLAEEHLLAAHGAGVLAAEEALGREVDLGPTDRELHAPLVDDLEPSLVGNLRGTLIEGLERQEDLAALGERVDAVFTELKSGIVDEASVVSLLSAFELGTYDAWRTAGVGARRYVVCGEPRCDDGRCAENAEAGPVPMDQPFPSGDDAPPMGVGCHCTTMPVLESTS